MEKIICEKCGEKKATQLASWGSWGRSDWDQFLCDFCAFTYTQEQIQNNCVVPDYLPVDPSIPAVRYRAKKLGLI